jgi:hypothetical protein
LRSQRNFGRVSCLEVFGRRCSAILIFGLTLIVEIAALAFIVWRNPSRADLRRGRGHPAVDHKEILWKKKRDAEREADLV